MPRLATDRLPKYRKHRVSGQAVVTLDGKDFYLGPHGSKLSRAEYDRLVGEWQANGRRLLMSNGTADLTVNELVLAFWQHVQEHYVKAGEPTSEQDAIRQALRPLKRLYGELLARDFGPLKLKTVRQAMIADNLCRNTINKHVSRIRRMIKWAVENELVPPDVHHGLIALSGLRQGRSDARESEPVKPVPEAHVNAVLTIVSRQAAAMIQLQSLTGMRPGEVAIMRTCDLDTSGKVWTYTPATHKTEHHGHKRVVCLGPKAQEIVKQFLTTRLEDYLFKSEEAQVEHNATKRQQRKTPLWPSHVRMQAKRMKRRRRRQFSPHYTVSAYRRAIARGCEQANVPQWHPHQLRHNAATRLRREFGLEVARAVLGHRTPVVTEIYAELDTNLAASIMEKIG